MGYSDVPIGLQPFLRPNVNIEDFQIEEEEDQEEQEEQGEEDPKWTVEADKENQKEPPVASPARVAKAGSKLFVGTVRYLVFLFFVLIFFVSFVHSFIFALFCCFIPWNNRYDLDNKSIPKKSVQWC